VAALVLGAEHNMDPTAELEQQLRQSSFFVQASVEQQAKLTDRLDAYLTGLLDVLIDTGVVDPGCLGEVVNRNRALQAEERAARFDISTGTTPWPTVMVREVKPDDRMEPETPVDCAARMHVCKAVCCSLRFPLSAGEVETGKVKWELGHPYVIRHTDQGFCAHNDRATGRCGVYEDRPQVCRAYTCAGDERIWKDFDNMVLNEEFLNGRSPQRFRFNPPDPVDAVPVTFVRKGDGTLQRTNGTSPAPAAAV
jgi:Fe-S-cluster containining protein